MACGVCPSGRNGLWASAMDRQKIPEDQTGSIRPLVTPLSNRDMGVRRLAVDEVLANRVRSGTKQP